MKLERREAAEVPPSKARRGAELRCNTIKALEGEMGRTAL
jgi:hypothetical protein